MPHFAETPRHPMSLSPGDPLPPPGQTTHATATTDPRGILREAGDGFHDLLLGEWPDWRGTRLPAPLLACLRHGNGHCHRGRTLLVRCWQLPNSELHLLVATPLAPPGKLSLREYEIARRYAGGATHRTIAEELHIAPATVRNHLAAVYRKLRVNSKAQLWRALEHHLAMAGTLPDES